MAKYDWDFIKPIDNTASINALATGNNQINTGLAGIAGSVTGLADAFKQRNTDEILNTLMQAQTSAELPNALNAVAALQQQYGRGYDQSAVRTAMDTRGATLGQRDLQSINLQQAQAAQAAIPQMQQVQVERMRAMGVPEDQISAYAGINGIDTSSLANTLMNDFTGERTYNTGRTDRAEDIAYRNTQAAQAQQNWNTANQQAVDNINWSRSGDISKENPATSNLVYKDGKWVTSSSPGINRIGAYGALVNAIHGVESKHDNNAKNPNSSATGAGQFIDSTWLSMIKRNKPDLARGKSDAQILSMRSNGDLSAEMTQAYAQENANGLQKRGLTPTDGNVYLAHFAGLGGASALLKANPNASAESILGAKAARDNGNIIKGKTAGQVIQWANNKISGASKGGNAAAASQAINVPQAVAAKAVGGYSKAMTDLQNKFNLTTAENQGNTRLGSKGQTIDSWLSSKPVKDREGSTILTDYASKVGKIARNNAKLSNLPMDDQLKILDATHAWSLAPGGIITDKELNKHINGLVSSVVTSNKRNLEQGKKNIFEAQYQAFIDDLNKAGVAGLDRKAFRALINSK